MCVQAEGQPSQRLVIAEGLLGTLQDKLACSFNQLLSLPGSSLEWRLTFTSACRLRGTHRGS